MQSTKKSREAALRTAELTEQITGATLREANRSFASALEAARRWDGEVIESAKPGLQLLLDTCNVASSRHAEAISDLVNKRDWVASLAA